MGYKEKTTSFSHQAELYNTRRDEPYWAIFWEQGTGKTKTGIDLAGYLYMSGKIDAVFVLASNGVHRNWITDEIPTHLPEQLRKESYCEFYESPKASTKYHEQRMKRVLHHNGLAWLAMSYEGFMTKKGKPTGLRFLNQRRCLYILDEADKIKTPAAKRAQSIVTSGRRAMYKRIMTGTPITNSPFDVYTQMRFLDEYFWKNTPYGIENFAAFKTFFGKWIEVKMEKKTFPKLTAYRNLEILSDLVGSKSSRVLKDDVLDLPPKLYSRVYFEMTPEQRRVYKEIRDEFEVELRTGDTVTAPLAITRLLRMQQVTSGYLPSDDEGDDGQNLIPIDDENNPRLEALFSELESTPHAAIIWAKYTHDIDLICSRLQQSGEAFVRYDGKVSNDERAAGKAAFQAGEAKWFVGNPAAGADGITLTAAKTVFYYNNSFKLRDRLQSEDRAHRIGQEGIFDVQHGGHAVLYKDLCGSGTIDSLIIQALVQKRELSQTVLGDEILEWL